MRSAGQGIAHSVPPSEGFSSVPVWRVLCDTYSLGGDGLAGSLLVFALSTGLISPQVELTHQSSTW